MTRVLIVEDEPDLADPLAYLLRREGFDVEIADHAVLEMEAVRDDAHLFLDLPYRLAGAAARAE